MRMPLSERPPRDKSARLDCIFWLSPSTSSISSLSISFSPIRHDFKIGD